MIYFTNEQISQLKALGSSPRFSAQGGKTGSEAYECELIDDIHNKAWAKGFGRDEEKALDAALKNARPGSKPKTSAEMAQELKQYKEKYGDLNEKGEQKPQESQAASGGEQSTGTSAPSGPSQPATEQDIYDQMKPSDLKMALTSRGLTVPDGDIKTNAWKQEAVNALKAHDKQAAVSQ